MTNISNQVEISSNIPSREEQRKKLHVKSFGCQMNLYDATRMSDALVPAGYDDTADIEQADLVILNTCHIRERASEKVFSELGKIRELKLDRARRGLSTLVAVAGCVAQAEGAEIFRRQKAVDLVVGPQSYHRLPALLARAGLGEGVIDTEFPLEDKFDFIAPPTAARTRRRGVSAFLTVQEGCDKFCSFCVVPYTRGAEVSRPVAKILLEARRLIADGVREIILLGQNVNAYHGLDADGSTSSLAKLLRQLASIPGLARLRYMTSHPIDMAADLILAHAELAALMPFLHLPVQSGSDDILRRMNRGHTTADYMRTVADVRRARPDIALSSDFIVGFPGETDRDFEATVALVRQVNFASTYFFKYSPRPGTPGASLDHQIAPELMDERLARLKAVVEEQRHAFNQSMTGRVLDVLFEKPGRRPGQVTGRSPYSQPVHVDASASLIGQVREVEILEAGPNSLFGRMVTSPGEIDDLEVHA